MKEGNRITYTNLPNVKCDMKVKGIQSCTRDLCVSCALAKILNRRDSFKRKFCLRFSYEDIGDKAISIQ
jgi:hypothetical protein